jgi:hypothetical protein
MDKKLIKMLIDSKIKRNEEENKKNFFKLQWQVTIDVLSKNSIVIKSTGTQWAIAHSGPVTYLIKDFS